MTDLRISRPPLIDLRGVAKVFGKGAATVRALDGIDLRIAEGEFVAIMGASGSGTTGMFAAFEQVETRSVTRLCPPS